MTGQKIGPYLLTRQLGAGGMGEVYLGRDLRLERDVALKILPRAFTHDAEQLGRFRREALTLASLNHPNIATIYGFEEPQGGPMVLVLEYVEGESLAQRIERGAMPVEEALNVSVQVAEALEVAHENGVVHRDMKPGNVMIGPRGLVKVLDFGLAKKGEGLLGLRSGGAGVDGETVATAGPAAPAAPIDLPPAAPATGPLTEAGAVMGTPGYMSPEQVLAGEQDERTDVFAFACVLFECLTGKPAFGDGSNDYYRTMAAVLYDAPDLSLLPPRTPARVRELLVRCFEKDREQRLREMRVARNEIEEALGIRRAAALRAGEAPAIAHNLPVPPTRFIGREATLAECAELGRTARLLTLTGMGGSGKTRLAIRLAELELDQHPDGVWFVDLASLTDGARVAEAVASVLKVHEEPGRTTLQSISAVIGTRRMLLLLDNSESVLEATAALIAGLLRECPSLRILATSREVLGVEGEAVYPVPTLTVPDADQARTPGAIASSEAVLLFVERAALVQPGFELNDGNGATIAAICRSLDGIPLAIELAAARVKVLGVQQIHARLDDRFRLLTSGGRGAVPRQQTLLATIQWSWDHLLPREQELMPRLAAFQGGWTLERATRVCEEQGDEFEILDLLTRLVERSLVVVERVEGEGRYRFLESVRQFAVSKLEESGEAPAVRARHLETYLALAEESEKHLTGPTQARWFTDLEREGENLLGALAWCARVPEGGDKALRLAGSVCRVWSALGRYELGRRALADALRLDVTAAPTPARAKALVRAGGFALYLGDFDGARPPIEESLAICRQLGDPKGVARALGGLSVVAVYQSDYETAENILEESLEAYQELGEKRGIAQALHNLGIIAWRKGRPDEARRRYLESLALMEPIGDHEMMALTLSGLAACSTRLGDLDDARSRFAAALDLILSLGARREGVYNIEGIAELAFLEGRARDAARLLGAAEALREAIGSPATPGEQEDLAALLDRVRGAVPPESFAAEWAVGRTLDFESAMAEGRAALTATPAR